jgi:hypothetical protein
LQNAVIQLQVELKVLANDFENIADGDDDDNSAAVAPNNLNNDSVKFLSNNVQS